MNFRHIVGLLTLLVLSSVGGLTAEVRIPHVFVEGGSRALVKVPAGIDVLVWQSYDASSREWRDVEVTRNFETGRRSKVAAPSERKVGKASRGIRPKKWRLIGKELGAGKFPAAFYTGANRFGAMQEDEADGELRGGPVFLAGVDAIAGEGKLAEPLESDIWKVDGETIYYFNELRGLQVIDAADPADPVVTAALRMPARGQDLYLLPGGVGDGGRQLLMVTHGAAVGGSTKVTKVEVEGGAVDVLGDVEVDGWPVDSRIIGGRLYLLTSGWYVQAGASFASYSPKARLYEIDLAGGSGVVAQSVEIAGTSPVLSAGSNWLAVASTIWAWSNGKSEVRVFSVGVAGMVARQPSPLTIAGTVGDSFKMTVRDDVLTVISQSWQGGWNSRVTVLENFRLGDGAGVAPLGSLELARGESLFATRFDGDTAYIVTFEQIDPLWVVDLKDPAVPTVVGHLEVPGWSTHMVPLGGGKIFAVGFEDGRVSTSLFDVSDPASPKLLGRVNVGDGWSWSEATWDEKALAVLPAEGLALLPFSTWAGGVRQDAVQILKIDTEAGTLEAKGIIEHAFTPRRAAALGSNLASISGRELTIVDVADLSEPSVVSSVALAWPVDRVLLAGDRLLQIEEGIEWSGSGLAVLRVSPTLDPEAVEFELELGAGSVSAAEVQGDFLYLIRNARGTGFPWARLAIPDLITPPVVEKNLVLEIYSLTGLPKVSKISTVNLPVEGTGVNRVDMAWPTAGTLVVLAREQVGGFGWWSPMPIIIDDPVIMPARSAASASLKKTGGATLEMAGGLSSMIYRWPRPISSAWLVSVDVTQWEAPVAGSPISITGLSSLSPLFSSDGIVAFGMGQRVVEAGVSSAKPGELPQVTHYFAVYDVGVDGSLSARSLVDLPGEVLAVSEFDKLGALLWTKRKAVTGSPGFLLEVCTWDGTEAYLTASLPLGWENAAVDGRSVFITEVDGVKGYLLNDSAQFASTGTWSLGGKPSGISANRGTVLATSGQFLHATKAFPAHGVNMESSLPVSDLETVVGSGPWFAPAGAYGVELFQPGEDWLK